MCEQMKGKKNTGCSDCPAKDKGIFCSLSMDSLTDISEHKITNIYKKGQNLFVQGNHPYGIYCISKGNIKVTKMSNDGKESIVRVVTAGDLLGHRSLFTKDHYKATATAMEDTKACFLDKKFIMKVITDNPSVSTSVIEKLSRDMGAAENKMSSLHQKNVRERLAELLLILKESHGEEIAPGEFQINLKLTREEMATMIGTANETLIRFISEFKQSGLIRQNGKIIIVCKEEELIEWANLEY